MWKAAEFALFIVAMAARQQVPAEGCEVLAGDVLGREDQLVDRARVPDTSIAGSLACLVHDLLQWPAAAFLRVRQPADKARAEGQQLQVMETSRAVGDLAQLAGVEGSLHHCGQLLVAEGLRGDLPRSLAALEPEAHHVIHRRPGKDPGGAHARPAPRADLYHRVVAETEVEKGLLGGKVDLSRPPTNVRLEVEVDVVRCHGPWEDVL
mmetsp:Transcript_17500/g.67876  ORF Transcript_17500/g.67876 Transcript_17500/m.67876 type:complete len:208 (-) Transcript_17500:536-1159(-)